MSDNRDLVWIPSKTCAWELATVLTDNDGTLTVEVGGERKEISKSSIHRADTSHFQDHEDLCRMNHLHEAPLLDCLRRRFVENKIYTTTGDVLISVNPFKAIPGLYESILTYLDIPDDGFVDSTATSPHVYKIANMALVEMIHGKHGAVEGSSRNQSIVVSGESGAGKTEASKHVMHFLIEADPENNNDNHSSNNTNKSDKDLLGEKIKNVLLQSNYILEAFGNSKTVRNDNSSRFGKYIKLQYSSENRLVSAFTETFLLEKSRLMNINANERNYHFFYQFLRHNENDSLKQKLLLKEPEQFKILLDSNGKALPSLEDIHYQDVLQALRVLGTTEEEIEELLTIIAAILHCGNLNCIMLDDNSTAGIGGGSNDEEFDGVMGNVKISCSSAPLSRLTEWLGLAPQTFVGKLTTQRVKAGSRRSVSFKRLNQTEIMNNVAALMKWLYSSLFNWLIRKINFAHCSVTANDRSATKFIGILDIFGFEILQTNSFEQLCINFTNERLQQQFNEFVFDREQVLYDQEGIDWATISYRDNQHVIDLIGKKPTGLLILLEGQGMLNRGSADEAPLLSSFNQTHDKKNAAYEKSRFGNDGKFTIKHFAGDVTYLITGFLDKNNDALQDDLMELMLCSTNVFVQNAIIATSMNSPRGVAGEVGFIEEIAPEKIVKSLPTVANSSDDAKSKVEGAVTPPPPPGAAGNRLSTSAAGGKKMASTATVSFQFRNQLDLLLATLRSTSPHYIKCIKPNPLKQPDIFDAMMVVEQLKYSGALEVVRIRQEGYPICMDFLHFYENFEALGVKNSWKSSSNLSLEDPQLLAELKHYCETMCNEHLILKDDYQIGHSKVFLRNHSFEKLFDAVQDFLCQKVVVIQKSMKRCLARLKLRAIIRGIKKLQAYQRMKVTRKNFHILLEEKRAAEEAERRRLEEERIRLEQERIRLEEERLRLEAEEKERQRLIFLEQQAEEERLRLIAEEQEQKRKLAEEEAARRQMQEEAEQQKLRLELEAIKLRAEEEKKQPALETSMESAAIVEPNPEPVEKVTAESLMHDACFAGDIAKMTALLKRMGDFDMTQICRIRDERESRHCRTLLQSAVLSGNYDLVRALSPTIEDIREQDSEGNNAAHYAILSHKKSTLDMLRYFAIISECTTEQLNAIDIDIASIKFRPFVLAVSRGRSASAAVVATSAMLDDGSMPNVTLELKKGWLSKRGESQTWRKRWVVLTTQALMYFRNEHDRIPRDSLAFANNAFTIERTPGKATALDIYISNPSAKKKRDRISLMADNERELQQWLNLIKAAAGVEIPPLRDPTVNGNVKPFLITNPHSRSSLFANMNYKKETILHVLCKEKFPSVEIANANEMNEGDAIAVITWLANNSCSMNNYSAEGLTPLQLAVAQNNEEIAGALALLGGNPNIGQLGNRRNSTSLHMAQTEEFKLLLQNAYSCFETRDGLFKPAPARLKGFHYLSLGFYFSTVSNAGFFVDPSVSTRYALRVSAFNANHMRLSESELSASPFIEPPIAGEQRWRWTEFYHLQFPLDNIDDRAYIRIELMDVSDEINFITLARAQFYLERQTIGNEVRWLKLFFERDESLLHSTLEMEMIVTRKM